MTAQLWLLVAAVLGIALIGGFTAGMTLVYVLRLRRPRRDRPRVAHVQQRPVAYARGQKEVAGPRPAPLSQPPAPPPASRLDGMRDHAPRLARRVP